MTIFKHTLSTLLLVAFGGVFGGFITGAFLIWPTIYGANWWEIFTAIGTVSTAVTAVWLGLKENYQRDQDRLNKANVIANLVLPKLIAL